MLILDQFRVDRKFVRDFPTLRSYTLCVCSEASVVSHSATPESQSPWDSPAKNTGVGCHALLQGIFLTQGWNSRLLCLLHWVIYHYCHLEFPPNINYLK